MLNTIFFINTCSSQHMLNIPEYIKAIKRLLDNLCVKRVFAVVRMIKSHNLHLHNLNLKLTSNFTF